jgi:hypothetical protein
VYIIPNSTIRILKDIPLDNSYRNTIKFADSTAQLAYFVSKAKYTCSDYTYVREENKLRVGYKADSLFDCNYIMYQNTAYGSKWFFAFINKVEYVNNECSNIIFEIDVMQTWRVNSDYTIMPSFVEREHVVDDTIGAHRVDEKIEYGEYIIAERVGTVDYSVPTTRMSDMAYLVGVADLSPLTGETDTTIGGIYGHLYSGISYWIYKESEWEQLKTFLQNFIAKPDAIIFISALPAFLVANMSGRMVDRFDIPEYMTVGIDCPYGSIDGYIPKNNKLFTYPYNALYVTNNQGGSATFRYEEFKKEIIDTLPDITFQIHGHISPNPTIQCSPVNYKTGNENALGVNTEYSLAITGYPLCSWNTDTYKAWVAQNGAGVALQLVGGVIATAGGAVAGNPFVIGGGILSVLSATQQAYKASLQPDQARGNATAGSLNIASMRQQFYFQKMQIRNEFARKIDAFFDVYGYRINEIKIPNIDARPVWNYVKTIDINLVGSVPADDMKKIQEIYDKGITFWKKGDEVGHYDLSNAL